MVIHPDAHEDFRTEWFDWWDSINPEWRQRASGRLVVGGSGKWSGMIKPGKCGLLLVLECLVGLRVAASVEDLMESIRDVDWVVQHILEELRNTYVDYILPYISALISPNVLGNREAHQKPTPMENRIAQLLQIRARQSARGLVPRSPRSKMNLERAIRLCH